MRTSTRRMWFLFDHRNVTGPYSGDEVNDFLEKGIFSDNDLIWAKGHAEWMPLGQWEDTSDILESPVWYYHESGMTTGPLTLTALVERIQKNEITKNARFWMAEYKDWMTIYQVSPIMDALNMCRRKFYRAPASGKCTIAEGAKNGKRYEMVTLSQGGLGIRENIEFSVGEEFNIRVEANPMQGTVYAKARVLYKSHSMTGLEFVHLSDENRAAIIDYVRQFEFAGISQAA